MNPFLILLTLTLLGLSGCQKTDSPKEKEQNLRVSTNSGSPDFETIFTKLVEGSTPQATEQQQQSADDAVEKVFELNKEKTLAFLEFLKTKLKDPSPFVRMEAGFHIAIIRNELKMPEQNEDLIPLFVQLLQDEDLWVRKFALNDVDPVIRESRLGEKRLPFVDPLIAATDEPFTTYQAISFLGDLGPLAEKAVPAIKQAAKRDKDPIINQAAKEAIQKIEGKTK